MTCRRFGFHSTLTAGLTFICRRTPAEKESYDKSQHSKLAHLSTACAGGLSCQAGVDRQRGRVKRSLRWILIVVHLREVLTR